MPVRVPFIQTDVYTVHEIDRKISGVGGLPGVRVRSSVVVPATGWTSDAVTHPSAPETFYYADVVHKLASETAHVVAALGADTFLITAIQHQQFRDQDTTRIWLAYQPAYALRCSCYA